MIKVMKIVDGLNICKNYIEDGEIVYNREDHLFYILKDKFFTSLNNNILKDRINEYISIFEKDGEVICDKCNGISRISGEWCDKCFGEGKLLWSEHLIGGKNMNNLDCFNGGISFSSFGMSGSSGFEGISESSCIVSNIMLNNEYLSVKVTTT